MAAICRPSQEFGSGFCALPGRGGDKSQRIATLQLSVRDFALSGHAEVHTAMFGPLDFHDPMYLPLLFMLLALLAGLALSPRRVRPRDLVLLMAVVPAALRSMRHIPILMLVLVPIVAGLAEAWLQQMGVGRFLEVGQKISNQANPGN